MERLVEDLRAVIPAAFETDEYRARHHEIDAEFNDRQAKAFEEVRDRAAKKDVALIQTPSGGFAFAPRRNGEAIDPETFSKLREEERKGIETVIRGFQEELEKVIQQIPKLRHDKQRKIRELNRAVTSVAVNALIEELNNKYEKLPEVRKYIGEVQNDIVDNAESFRQPKEGEQVTLFSGLRFHRLGTTGHE
jgi:uncharacterized protein YoxC